MVLTLTRDAEEKLDEVLERLTRLEAKEEERHKAVLAQRKLLVEQNTEHHRQIWKALGEQKAAQKALIHRLWGLLVLVIGAIVSAVVNFFKP